MAMKRSQKINVCILLRLLGKSSTASEPSTCQKALIRHVGEGFDHRILAQPLRSFRQSSSHDKSAYFGVLNERFVIFGTLRRHSRLIH